MIDEPFSTWDLPKWLDFLENRHFKEVRLRLEDPKKIAKRLNVLNWQIPVITIAGTNGKGSTAASLQAIYKSAGYRVGCFTSPHLIEFNERICVDNKQISDDDLCKAFSQIESVRGDVNVTYFEASLLAALLYFKSSSLDVIILEVGLGGRLDATNIIDSDLSIITTIALDHEEYLGNNLEQIGFEKAGIMRAHKTCIFADEFMPESIEEHAKQTGTNLLCLGRDYTYTISNNILQIDRNDIFNISLPIPLVNMKSAMAAIVASDCLSDLIPVTSEHWCDAMLNVHIPGRLHLVDKSVKLLYDVSHNPQSVELLANYILGIKNKGRVHAVFSGLSDKKVRGLIKPLTGIVSNWYPALLEHKRGASESELVDALYAETNYDHFCYKNPVAAYDAAASVAKAGDLIVIYGSFLLVGAVMENLTHESIDI
ncbi:MAG: bifunctional tetrahydrofolate synthase/dihydrofolate synthase [Legionellaceae bacterium]|nr:bifunctional tetrahydrofolate synthase/dihydrofolate synthase [Legionellaceae bacterium]